MHFKIPSAYGKHLEEEEGFQPLGQQVVCQFQLGNVGQTADADAAGADGPNVMVAVGHDRWEHPFGHIPVGVLLYGGEHVGDCSFGGIRVLKIKLFLGTKKK